MANHDPLNDPTPVQTQKKPTLPTISALRTALNTFNATSYSSSRLDTMNRNDMIYAARIHGLSVAGL